MYLEGGWKPPIEPAPKKPKMSDRDERMIMWMIVLFAMMMLIGPIGGGTILQAFMH